jgi:hypothetical protein
MGSPQELGSGLGRLWVLLIGGISFFAACQQEAAPAQDPIARVHDRYLYPADLEGIGRDALNPQDSSRLLDEFIEGWINRQLILHVAEANLSAELEDIDRQAQEYRESLLIDAYLKEFIGQRVDTVVAQSEIDAYYEANKSQFILRSDLYKVDYALVKEGTANIDSLKLWFARPDRFERDIARFCGLHCVDYRIDAEIWFSLADLRGRFPSFEFAASLNPGEMLQIPDGDKLFLYKVRDKLSLGRYAPVAYHSNSIASRIMNNRRRELSKRTYRELWIEGAKQDVFERYDQKPTGSP